MRRAFHRPLTPQQHPGQTQPRKRRGTLPSNGPVLLLFLPGFLDEQIVPPAPQGAEHGQHQENCEAEQQQDAIQ